MRSEDGWGRGMIDKFDMLAENYEDKYRSLAKEIFKEGLKLGYEKAKKSTVDAEPVKDAESVKHKKWVERYDTKYHYECPYCWYLDQYEDRFCPCCGERIRWDI